MYNTSLKARVVSKFFGAWDYIQYISESKCYVNIFCAWDYIQYIFEGKCYVKNFFVVCCTCGAS